MLNAACMRRLWRVAPATSFLVRFPQRRGYVPLRWQSTQALVCVGLPITMMCPIKLIVIVIVIRKAGTNVVGILRSFDEHLPSHAARQWQPARAATRRQAIHPGGREPSHAAQRQQLGIWFLVGVVVPTPREAQSGRLARDSHPVTAV